MTELYKVFYACCLWLWLNPPLVVLQYINVLLVLWMTSHLQILARMMHHVSS